MQKPETLAEPLSREAPVATHKRLNDATNLYSKRGPAPEELKCTYMIMYRYKATESHSWIQNFLDPF